ncbi:MAG TPA: pectinesterase family protein [Flavisolibacter sp.]|nr:pectinesterase family protein [Flavisolibacter sp.]
MTKKIYLLLASLLFIVAAFSQRKEIVVSQDGTGDYNTVQAAFNAVPKNNKKPVTILVKKGLYKEKLLLDSSKRFVTLLGEDKFTTILTYDDHSGKITPGGETINTYTSQSFLTAADDFTARNITFQNDAGFTAGQAVSIRILGDRTAFFNCRFVGNQDVLFPSKPYTRQYFAYCYIEGTTDFIFGPSSAWFEGCHIHSKKNSHITAASTPKETAVGYVFNDCVLTADTALRSVSLGRPWQPYASVTYINCWMGNHIQPAGWNNWQKPANEATARYAEYNSFGPGANAGARLPWTKQLTTEEVKKITLKSTLGDWNPLK